MLDLLKELVVKVFTKPIEVQGPSQFFSQRKIELTSANIVHINCDTIEVGKVVPFCKFKENIYYYSELMETPCAEVLWKMELQAQYNARKGGVAEFNV